MVQIRQELEIAASPEKIFAAIVDLTGYDRWLPSSPAFAGITEISPGPVGLGTTWTEVGPSGTRHGTVTRWQPPTGVTFHQPMTMKSRRLGVIDITVAIDLTPGPDSVTVRRVVTVSPGWPLVLVRPLVLRPFRTESGRTLRMLKSFVERPTG